jgi:very-short-patch-repair endonuclease
MKVTISESQFKRMVDNSNRWGLIGISEVRGLTYTTDEFRKLASEKNPEYDFSDSVFYGFRKPTEVKCKKEGHLNFKSTPEQILGLTINKWKGCPECYNENLEKTNLDSIKEKLNNYINKYKLDWDLSNVKVKSDGKNISIYDVYCNKHKKFLNKFRKKRLDSTTDEHLILPCDECDKDRKKKLFIDEANNIWCENNVCQFNYDDIELTFENGKNFVKNIRCNIHPDVVFNQRKDQHLNKHNPCPLCQRENESVGETTLEKYFIDNKIKHETQRRFEQCTNQMEGTSCRELPFDFYLYDKNILVEIDGTFHFESNVSGDKEYQRRVFLDKLKNEYAKNNVKKIIRIYWGKNLNNDKKKNKLFETFEKLMAETTPSIPETNIYLSDDYPKKGWNAPDSDQKDIEPINEIILRIKSLMK